MNHFGTGALIRERAELIERGVLGRELTDAVRYGELLRLRRGVYALPGTADAVVRSFVSAAVSRASPP